MNKFQKLLGFIGIRFIRLWVKTFGRTVRLEDVPWLIGPIGPEGKIGDKPYEIIAQQENLSIENDPNGALIQDFEQLQAPHFHAESCDHKVRHFYENTAKYDLDAWSETRFPGRLFLWLIVTTVSRYMNQLNFPVFGLEMSKGMRSEILSLKNDAGETVHTGWYRRLKESDRVIYTGFYSLVKPPHHDGNCVKVVFPLPKGNATVILKPSLNEKNEFELISSGKAFGYPGFYRIVDLGNDKYKVLYMKRLKEHFTVYTDAEGTLRCDHKVHFMGMLMLKLHYCMELKG